MKRQVSTKDRKPIRAGSFYLSRPFFSLTQKDNDKRKKEETKDTTLEDSRRLAAGKWNLRMLSFVFSLSSNPGYVSSLLFIAIF